MGNRRKSPNGSGTIFRRPNGRWEARLTITLPTGERKRVSHTGKTRKDCDVWLTELRHRQQVGDVVAEADMRLIDWLRSWLVLYCLNIRTSTRTSYETAINRHLAEHPIAQIPLRSLSTSQLQQFVLFLAERGRLDEKGGLSAKTVRNVMLVLTSDGKLESDCS